MVPINVLYRKMTKMLKGESNPNQEYDSPGRSFETMNFGTSFTEIDA